MYRIGSFSQASHLHARDRVETRLFTAMASGFSPPPTARDDAAAPTSSILGCDSSYTKAGVPRERTVAKNGDGIAFAGMPCDHLYVASIAMHTGRNCAVKAWLAHFQYYHTSARRFPHPPSNPWYLLQRQSVRPFASYIFRAQVALSRALSRSPTHP